MVTVESGAGGQSPVPWWDPMPDLPVDPDNGYVQIAGRRIGRGSRVVLRPGSRRTDAQDMFLAGRTATVRALYDDVDGRRYLAVTVDGDPAADLQLVRACYRYFTPDEVEPVDDDVVP